MKRYQKIFNEYTTQNYPDVTEEYLFCLGIDNTAIERILKQNYNVVAPVWDNGFHIIGNYLLVRKDKFCGVIYRNGNPTSIVPEYKNIASPINSVVFAVEKNGKWGVMNPDSDIPVVEFGKYKYIWQYINGLCLVNIEGRSGQIGRDRGLIDSQGKEIIEPYTYEDLWRDFSNNCVMYRQF